MTATYWFDNPLSLAIASAIATLILIVLIYLTKLSANKFLLVICAISGLANILLGYRVISIVDAASGNALMTAKDFSTAADIKMWSAAIVLLGVGALFAMYRKFKLA